MVDVYIGTGHDECSLSHICEVLHLVASVGRLPSDRVS